MKKIFFIPALSAIFLLSLFSSCERDADIDLPPVAPKLVLLSFITPQDTLISVSVTRSQPVFAPSTVSPDSPVIDATVIMASSSGSVQLTFDPLLERYTIPVTALPIIAGNSYSLTVTTPNGESANAETTVPGHNGVNGFSVSITDSVSGAQGFLQVYTKFIPQVTDFSGEENRYRFFASVVIRDTVTNDTSSVRFMSHLFNDNGMDGQQLQSILNGEWAEYIPFSTRKVIGYDCWMYNANIDYYQYHNSLYNYHGDDAFSEPTIIYTNVDGGLGVFAAANGTKLRIYR
jgi:hypothetical protein